MWQVLWTRAMGVPAPGGCAPPLARAGAGPEEKPQRRRFASDGNRGLGAWRAESDLIRQRLTRPAEQRGTPRLSSSWSTGGKRDLRLQEPRCCSLGGAEWVKCADRVARVTLKALATPRGARGTTSGFCWLGKTHPAPRRGSLPPRLGEEGGGDQARNRSTHKTPGAMGERPRISEDHGCWARLGQRHTPQLLPSLDPGGPTGSGLFPKCSCRGVGAAPCLLGGGIWGGRPLRERGDGEGEEKQQRRRVRLPLWLRSSEAESPLQAAPARSERSPQPTGSAPEHDTRGLPGGLQEHLPWSPATSRLSPEAAWIPTLRWAPPTAATASPSHAAEARPPSPLDVGPRGGQRTWDRLRERESNLVQGPD